MSRKLSHIAPEWWDYTTLDDSLINDAANLTADDLLQLSRSGFKIVFYDTLEDFYLAEALEYLHAWQQSTADNPVGICGPVGPTEQMPLVARLVNELNIDLKSAHFWGMDEWVGKDGKAVSTDHPLSFERTDRGMLFNKIKPELVMGNENLHFPTENVADYISTWDGVRCAVMQGGQGDIKHWAFNDPLKREGKYADAPPTPEEYRALGTRIVDLHPVTLAQNARTSGGGNVTLVPAKAVTVGSVETWKAEKVSIWHAGTHDNPLGQRLTALMISKGIADSSVPMSLLADHPNVQFNYYRPGIGSCDVDMH
ncbi:MAG: glucosamine-6-phosphate isomerase [Verrucomicrobiales bacterium]|nr:glucosamine-6-phosphate isomerase [Verrucomicrobiales bacterium]